MAKWIADGTVVLREVHGTRRDSVNALSGNPTFTVRLSVAADKLTLALEKLLGNPEVWPYDTIFTPGFMEPRAVSAETTPDLSRGTTDSDSEIINYPFYFLDVTYIARNGIYGVTAISGEDPMDIYTDDVITVHNESHPLNHKMFIWGLQQTGLPTDITRQLAPDETPVRYSTVESFVHTIEGNTRSPDEASVLIATVNDTEYQSIILDRIFAPGTLLLRNMEVFHQYTFISYRPGPGIWSGRPTPNVRLHYEYKERGWDRFYRVDTVNNVEGYYYIRYAMSPNDIYTPFPPRDHTKWLQ